MLRTWAVRLPAMEFTLSVRSFHVPATPRTSAWPPSLPSEPTSRATRVTSDANDRSWSTIVLMVFLSSRISPRTSTVIFFERSPVATAVVTSAMLRTWAVRFAAIEFTLSVRSFHVPATPFTSAWPPSFPSVPTSRTTRVTSEENAPSCPTIRFTVFAVRRNSPCSERPSWSSAMVWVRSPLATAPIIMMAPCCSGDQGTFVRRSIPRCCQEVKSRLPGRPGSKRREGAAAQAASVDVAEGVETSLHLVARARQGGIDPALRGPRVDRRELLLVDERVGAIVHEIPYLRRIGAEVVEDAPLGAAHRHLDQLPAARDAGA